MAHFYGMIEGQARTPATRRGSKKSGLVTRAATWNGAIEVHLWHDEHAGVDRYEIKRIPWQGAGYDKAKLIEEGIVD